MSSAATQVHVAVRDALADVPDGAVVLVACSGGPDSLALAAATAGLAGRHGWRAGAVVVDHGWSPDASAASVRAAQACTALGLSPVDLVSVDCTGDGGPEAAARTARYAALDTSARRNRADVVLLGHTLDDQAETVLLGLARGSGARSLAGMPARRGPYRRPFLGLGRSTTVAACAEMGLHPWHDPANDDPAYARVRVRRLADQLVSALGPGVVAGLARSADLLRDDADALDEAAASLLAEAEDGPAGAGNNQRDAGNDLELGVAVLLSEPVAVRRRALLSAARRAGSPAGSLGHRHALALDALLTGRDGSADLPGGVRARVTGGSVLFTRPAGTPGRPAGAGMGNLTAQPLRRSTS